MSPFTYRALRTAALGLALVACSSDRALGPSARLIGLRLVPRSVYVLSKSHGRVTTDPLRGMPTKC